MLSLHGQHLITKESRRLSVSCKWPLVSCPAVRFFLQNGMACLPLRQLVREPRWHGFDLLRTERQNGEGFPVALLSSHLNHLNSPFTIFCT